MYITGTETGQACCQLWSIKWGYGAETDASSPSHCQEGHSNGDTRLKMNISSDLLVSGGACDN